MRRAVVVLLVLLPPVTLAAGEAEAVRGALGEGRPPWYDPVADGWRRVEVREPDPPKLPDLPGGPLPGAQVVVALLLAGLLVAVAWVVWQLIRLRTPATPSAGNPDAAAAARPAPDLSQLPLPDAGLPPGEGLRRALAAGDWRRAVVWAHAQLLTRLDAAGAVRLERGATERHLLAAAYAWAQQKPARRPAAEALERTGAAFAAVYFGHATADRALVDRLLAATASAERALAAEGA